MAKNVFEIFRWLYSINWRHFIAWLRLLLEIMGNMCIVIACKLRCDIINFSYMIKKSRQKFKYLENEKSFMKKSKMK